MKKLLILLLTVACALCLAFAVAGCKPDGGESSGGTNTQQGETGGSGETGGGSEETGGEQEVNPPVTNKYTVTYDANGGKFAEGGSTITQSVEELSKLTAPLSPARSNYAFSGWAKNKSGSEMWKFEEDTVTGNITLYAQWTQESAVILSVEGASIEDKSIFMLVDKDTDSISLSSKVVCSDDSIWRLYSDPDGQREIPTKMVTRLSNGNNTYYIVVNSQNQAQVNVYELTVHRSYLVTVSYYDDESLLDTAELYTGDTFTASYLPDITGYTFNGWKELNGTAFTSDVIYSPLVLYADKTANTYKATFDVNGGNTLSETEKTVTYDSEYSFPVPTRTGYSFTGWYADGTQLTNEKGKSLSIWQYDKAQNITAHWSANNYKVTLNVNDTQAGTVYGDGEHAYDSQVIIDVYTTNLGYNFIGWYDKDNQLVSGDKRYTFKMGFAVSYTAKWEVDPAMENFVFTSTPTTCTISDVKDNSVQTIDIPDYVTSIGGGAFSGCTNLESLTLPFVGNGSGKTHLGYIFSASSYVDNSSVPTSLKTVIITGGNSIGNYAFNGCTNLESVTIPENVTSIGKYAFVDCTAEIIWGDNPSIKEIGENAFHGYLGTSVTIPESVTSIGSYAFNGCTADIKWGDNPSIKEIGQYAFSGYKGTSITIPNGVTSIGSNAFSGCTGLTNMTIPNNVTSIGSNAFSGCTNLESLTLPFVGNGSYETHLGYIFGASKDEDNKVYVPSSLKTVIITGGNSIGYNAFYYCTNLESITIGDGVTSIGSYAFYICTSLESVTIGNSVKHISDYAFSCCENLTSITIPDSVVSIGRSAFSGCENLTSITIGNGVSSIGVSGEYDAFTSCSNLENITVSDGNIKYASQEGILYNKDKTNILFVSIAIKGAVTIGNSVKFIHKNAFYGCTAEIKWGDNPSIKEIGYCAFDGYKGTSITIPDSVTSIDVDAFAGCTNLEIVTIGNGVTSIGDYAFTGCTGLTSVTFANPNGWYCTKDSSATSGTDIKSEDLQKPGTAATYLKDTYYDYYWKRKTA